MYYYTFSNENPLQRYTFFMIYANIFALFRSFGAILLGDSALTALGAAFGLSSCNVTRTITTKSEYWQKADTSVVIQTKTIETYDASKKMLY